MLRIIQHPDANQGYENPLAIVKCSYIESIAHILWQKQLLQDAQIRQAITQFMRFPWYIIESCRYSHISQTLDSERFNITFEKFQPHKDHTIWKEKKFSTILYADTHNYLLLWYEGIPLAFLGFRFESYGRHIRVEQIQGANFYRKKHPQDLQTDNWFLHSFDWSQALVLLLEEYIKLSWLKDITIRIQWGFNNDYYPKGEDYDYIDERLQERQKRLIKIYDETAKRLGYIETLGGNFIKKT